MAEPLENAQQMIGNTPLVRLFGMEKEDALQANLLVKLEMQNPAGSVKDRLGKGLIVDAEERGLLAPGGVIVEPTSGNTGIGLAAYGIPRGYRVILTMPDTMSVERRSLLQAYGAELVLTQGAAGMSGAIEEARRILETTKGAFMPGQFDNPANPAVHEATTGPEIWRDTKGGVDCFVAGVGTGGTITGVGRHLKAQNPNVRIVAVEPAASPVLSGGKAGPHGIMGIGAGFVPKALDMALLDEILAVTEQDAYATGHQLAAKEGILCGVSGGAALWAGLQLAKRQDMKGKTIVVLLPDSGERYLSTPMFQPAEG